MVLVDLDPVLEPCLPLPPPCLPLVLPVILTYMWLNNLGMITQSHCYGIDKSFAVEVGSSSSMLHKSNLLEFIFQSSLHGYKGVAVLLAVGKEEGGEDAQAQLVVPDTSCCEGLTKVTSSNMSATFCPGYCCGLRLSKTCISLF